MEAIMKREIYINEVLFLKMRTRKNAIHIGLDLWIKAGTPILAGSRWDFIVLISMLVWGLWSNYYTGHKVENQTFILYTATYL
jgi:hypothetical protein